MRQAIRLSFFGLVFLLASCHDDAKKNGAAFRGQFCAQGGATLSAVTNECQCPSPQKWTGSKCEGAAVSNIEPKATALVPEPPVTVAEPAPVIPSSYLTPAQLESLKQACGKAHAAWLEAEQFCQCPNAKVLVGEHCRKLRGRVTDDACLRAIKPGRWHKGDCDCPGTDTFVPQRGGCVPPAREQAEIQKLSCESSLDLGHWDGGKKRCECPKGRIWVDELCEIQTRMGSALVCQTDYNQGTWDWDKKRCSCPAGELWINQACLDPHTLPRGKVCESEWNRGSWNDSAQSCACPKGKQWDAHALICAKA